VTAGFVDVDVGMLVPLRTTMPLLESVSDVLWAYELTASKAVSRVRANMLAIVKK